MNINIEELIKKNANKFISVRESFERLQETSPKTPPSQIANLLIQYFIANENSSSMRAYLNSNTGEINPIEPLYSDSLEHEKLLRIISEKNLSLNEIDKIDCEDIGTFETGEFIYIDQLDTLGWYREGFNKTLDVNHNNVSGEEMVDCSNNSDIHESNTKQISQLQATIKELEAKLESLEANNSSLRQQLEARPTASEQDQGVEFLHFTNNLKLVAEVQKKHYSKEPYQKVETIRADMREKHQISGNLAVAIETVARPDKS